MSNKDNGLLEQIILYAKKKRIFTTEQIAIGLNLRERDNLNSYLDRLCDREFIYRYDRGIFAIMEEKELFKGYKVKMRPDNKDVINHLYLQDYNGYITGADFINTIGLSTWCPAKYNIASNKVNRKTLKLGAIIEIPKTTVTKDNFKYLQILDCINTIHEYPIDVKNPDELILRFIKDNNLDIGILVVMARKFYNKRTFDRLIDYMERRYRHGI